MKFILAFLIAFLCLVIPAFAFPSFEKYCETYGKQYGGKDVDLRRSLYDARVAVMTAHNSQGATWTMGVNTFTDMTETEKAQFRGRKKGITSDLLRAQMPLLKGAPAPTVDWRTHAGILTPVKTQGGCGSCWAFAATETIESAVAVATGVLTELAPQFLVDCSPNPMHCGGDGGCLGSISQLAFATAEQLGMYTEESYPYTGTDDTCDLSGKMPVANTNITGFVQLANNNYDALIAALNKAPVSVSVDASVWYGYESGILDACDQDTPDVNHVVQAVGYGTDAGVDYWIIRNSWGASYGEMGFIRLKRHNPHTGDATPCGIDVTPEDGSGCTNGPAKVKVCGTCGVLSDSVVPTIGYDF